MNWQDFMAATGLQTDLQADLCTFIGTLYAEKAPTAALNPRA